MFVRPVVRRLMDPLGGVRTGRIRAALTEPFAGGPDVTTVVPVEVDDGRATPVGRACVRLCGLTDWRWWRPPMRILVAGDEVTVMMLETPG